MENNSDQELDFIEFDGSSTEDWKAKAQKDLRDNPISSLDWKPYEKNNDLVLRPYYSKEQLRGLEYLQEFHRSRNNHRGWNSYVSLNNQNIEFEKSIETIAKAGANGVVIRVEEIDLVVKQLDKVSNLGLEVAIDTPNPSLLAEALFSLEQEHKFKYLITESYSLSLFENKWLDSNNCWKAICISSDQDSVDHQLADYLNNFHTILKEALNAEFDLEDLCDRIFIYSNTGSDFFLEIAKLRALRVLIKALLSAYSINNSREIEILCISSTYGNQDYDPHGSMIKSTYAGMSSIIGGCDTLIIEPHENSDLIQGVSAQISNILKEEAHLDKVNDPGAGSYFIENLTHQLINQTWSKFVENQSSK
jgi:methylmalonyl-CoA mutase